MKKDVSGWALVSAPIVMAGSAAQRINVMQMDTLSQLSAQHEERMAAVQAERDELRGALREYGNHQVWCLDKHLSEDANCQCGWNETRKRFAALAKADGTEPSAGGAP